MDKANKLAHLEFELADLMKRWPAHSVKPELIMKREDLEEEIARLRNNNKADELKDKEKEVEY